VTDPIGSMIYLVRDDGVTAAANTYDPYGVYLSADDAGSGDPFYARNPIKFAGGYKDKATFNGVNTNLYHFGLRYYDPATGNWTQQDSVVGLGDRPAIGMPTPATTQ
jgi:RHS repeat-associated protein